MIIFVIRIILISVKEADMYYSSWCNNNNNKPRRHYCKVRDG